MERTEEITRERLLAFKPDVSEFKVCPGCGDKFPLMNGVTGPFAMDLPEPSLWQVEDDQVPSKWFVVYGWICGNSVYGTVVLRGPDESRGERNPKLMYSHGHSYVRELTGRKVTPYL